MPGRPISLSPAWRSRPISAAPPRCLPTGPGARLGQDTIWWKAPRTKPVSHHQDTSFLDVLDPQATVTCWVTLDDTHRDAGTLEYVPGSHPWPLTSIPEGFHAPADYRAHMRAARSDARRVGKESVRQCRSRGTPYP